MLSLQSAIREMNEGFTSVYKKSYKRVSTW